METLVQQLIKAFGWSIINSLWQSAIIYGILFITMLALPKMAAKYRHNLAFGSILLMFGGFAWSFIKQMMVIIPNQSIHPDTENIQVIQYFNNLPPTFSSKAEQYFPIVVAFYIIGILLQLFVIIKGYNQLSKLKKENLNAVPDAWQLIFAQVTSRLKLRKYIQFQLSEMVNVPLVIGYLKPVVLFPVALVNQLEQDQVEAILIHELSHIRRNDFLLNLIKTAIETLLFYNPFVWMAGRFIHIEREHACDDLVLKITGKPLNYAHALLKLELLKDKNSPAYALAATGKAQNLYQRIKRITNMKTNYLNAKQQMAALTLGVACIFSIAWINPVQKKKDKVKANQQSLIHTDSDLKTVVYQDTSKKRKIKIVTIDKNGNRTEYNSLKEIPDSIRKDIYKDDLFLDRKAFRIALDSNFRFKDSVLIAKINRQFNSPEAQAKWKKFGEDVAKQYSSPEAQAKWKKYGEDIAKEYSSPEAQAKWKKFGEDIAKEFSSPEAQAKWQKFGEDVAKQYSSPEALAKFEKIGELVAALPNIEKLKDDTQVRIYADDNFVKLKDLKRIKPDTAFNRSFEVYTFDSKNGKTIELATEAKVRNSKEYQKLKEDFAKEVKALEEKMQKKENKEKSKNN